MNERLYFVNFYYPPLARSRRRYHYAHALADAGFRVTVITIANPSGCFNRFIEDPDNDISDPAIEVLRLPVPRWWATGEVLYTLGLLPCPQTNWGWIVAHELAKRLRQEPGIVLSLYPPIASHLGAAKAAKAAGCPLALDFRDEYAALDARGLRRWRKGSILKREGELVRAADLVSVTTEPVKESLVSRHNISAHKVVVTYNGIGGQLPAVRLNDFSRSPVRFVYAGAITSHQKPEIFCDAWHLLCKNDPELAKQASIVFHGPENRYARQHLFPKLHPPYLAFGGFLPADAAQFAVANADAAFVSLAGDDYKYATPGKLFECIGHCKPILASLPQGAASALIANTGAGMVTPAGDAPALAGALAALLGDRSHLSTFSENALAARPRLTLAEQVGNLARVMRERLVPLIPRPS